MEFNQKLQELRKQAGLSQEELADALYVSRTAVSKWESGRGYPNIESLKAIAAYFSVTIDELLSGDELLSIAQQNNRQTAMHLLDMVFGLLDLSVAAFLFLPLFGQTIGGQIYEVSLLSLTAIAPYLRIVYAITVAAMIVWGVLTLALQTCQAAGWKRCKHTVSVVVNAMGVLLFIISTQPYAATLLLIYLIIQAVILLKTQ